MNNKHIVMLGPSEDAMGGIATVVKNYEDAGLLSRWRVVYLETHAEGGRGRKVIAAVSACYCFVRMLLQNRVSLLHIHSAQYTSFWRKSAFALIAFAASCPVVFHLHGCEFIEFYNKHCGRLARKYVRFILEKSAAVIGLSEQWVRSITSIAEKAKVVCIYNLVPIPEREDFLPQAKRHPKLLFLGRLGGRKGTYDLIHAMVNVKEEIPNVVLQLGGDGEQQQVYESAKQLGLDEQIEILGWVRGAQKIAMLSEAAVYVLPSYNEGLPMGILEAMSYGLPVISTAIGGIPDAIESGKNGILIEPGDIAALSHAIVELLRNADTRQEIGGAARQTVIDKFSAEEIIPQLEDLYRSLGAEPVDSACADSQSL